MAYEYGTAISQSASDVLELPLDEITGFFGYQHVKNEMLDDGS